MKKLVLLVALLIVVAMVGNVMALPKGTRVFENKMGNVTLDADGHKDRGVKCNDCHPKVFPMKKGGLNMPKPHVIGESCGACHNGEKAFSQKDGANCSKCHVK